MARFHENALRNLEAVKVSVRPEVSRLRGHQQSFAHQVPNYPMKLGLPVTLRFVGSRLCGTLGRQRDNGFGGEHNGCCVAVRGCGDSPSLERSGLQLRSAIGETQRAAQAQDLSLSLRSVCSSELRSWSAPTITARSFGQFGQVASESEPALLRGFD